MQAYSKKFLKLAIEHKALSTGEFVLKSGRLSPYFFNAGTLNTGMALMQLAHCYAQMIVDSELAFDVLFGAAYKGIPLVSAIVAVFAIEYDLNYGFAYDRKEVKDHGEGGCLVGHDLNDQRILIVDDVISSGKAITQSIQNIQTATAELVGVALCFNRQERGPDLTQSISAIEVLEHQYKVPVVCLATMTDLLGFKDLETLKMSKDAYAAWEKKMLEYRLKYGSKN